MFNKILIANRGEIACRIMRTCRRLGVQTVAVYAEADRYARHVAMADEAVCIGPAAASESYLHTARLLDAARTTGAQAIHPGYGFVSENADFARHCAGADITFIGPAPETIEIMGSKSRSKQLMADAGVPVVPGWHGGEAKPEQLAREAKDIGFPLMIKAVAGGGGKGMRVVRSADDFAEALDGAQREARAAFGDDCVLLERYLEQPRHIEFQIFGDSHGNIVHLFERECSIQRRYQKIIEESPSPFLDERLRQEMGEAAVRAARTVSYLGAGTVEFIVDHAGDFFFMEMNTRLQVEHPVTEMTTGVDLVEWQLRVAAGEKLPSGGKALKQQGHAVEARIYAENPAQEFLPATGRINHLRTPPPARGLRLDSGVREGDRVSPHYDPMLAKLIVWHETRDGAISALREALARTALFGLHNNIAFLAAVAALPAFAAGQIDTGFVDTHLAQLIEPSGDTPAALWAVGAAQLLLAQQARSAALAAASGDPWSPWQARDGWQINATGVIRLYLGTPGQPAQTVTLTADKQGWLLSRNDTQLTLSEIARDGDTLSLRIDGEPVTAIVLEHDNELIITLEGVRHALAVPRTDSAHAEDDGGLIAPMPGRVVRVYVADGDRVATDAPLLVLEAMKMEYTVRAPADGLVQRILYREGDTVEADTLLAEFTTEEI